MTIATKPIRKITEPLIVIFDLFCGAGGTTTGFEMVEGCHVIGCVNHDENAIISHSQNHPDCEHFTEDITVMYGTVRHRILFMTDQMRHIQRMINIYRAFYPEIIVILWASLECTNFSKAKGGMSRDADSRTLANHLDRYIIPLEPDYVKIENVVEFMSWGPLMGKVVKTAEGYRCCELMEEVIEVPVIHKNTGFDYIDGTPVLQCRNGNPDDVQVRTKEITRLVAKHLVPQSTKNGQDYLRWCNHIDSLGYRNEWNQLNSADFGAYQSRNRLFGIFAKEKMPITWPEPTHQKVTKKKQLTGTLFGTGRQLAPWKPVRDVLDFTDEGKSIFDRSKELSDKTLERVYAGLVKFVAGGKDAFMVKWNSMGANGVYNAPSVDEPSPVIATQNRLGVAFIQKHFSGRPDGKVTSIDDPAGTLTTTCNQSVVYIVQRNSGEPDGRVVDINGPARTLTATGGNQELATTVFLTKYHSGEPDSMVCSVDEPNPTLRTKDAQAFIGVYHHGGGQLRSINEPAATIPTKDSQTLIQAHYLMRDFSNGENVSSLDQPCGSLTSIPKVNVVSCIINPSHGGHATGVDVPGPVVVARQDKAPLSVMNVNFLTATNFDNQPQSLDLPSPTITANRKHHYLISVKIDDRAEMFDMEVEGDKAPLALRVVNGDNHCVAIRIDNNDTEIMRKIKLFMVLYNIVDIKMRMLKILELLKIQGFPEDYVLVGTQADKKKFIGNAVHPLVPAAMARKLLSKLDRSKSVAA